MAAIVVGATRHHRRRSHSACRARRALRARRPQRWRCTPSRARREHRASAACGEPGEGRAGHQRRADARRVERARGERAFGEEEVRRRGDRRGEDARAEGERARSPDVAGGEREDREQERRAEAQQGMDGCQAAASGGTSSIAGGWASRSIAAVRGRAETATPIRAAGVRARKKGCGTSPPSVPITATRAASSVSVPNERRHSPASCVRALVRQRMRGGERRGAARRHRSPSLPAPPRRAAPRRSARDRSAPRCE